MIRNRTVNHWLHGAVIRRHILISAALFAAVLLLVAPAHAQEYATEYDDLALTTTVTITFELSGEGFVADSVVYVTATAGEVVLELGTIPTDDQGRFFGIITLPEDLEPGAYLIAATGVTPNGATRVLTSQVGVGVDLSVAPVADEPDTTTSSSATATTRVRGSGLDPIETTDTTIAAAPEPQADRDDPYVLIATALGFSIIGALAAWWWSYRRQT
jgi:methionine-rich copper-binding protein CopC